MTRFWTRVGKGRPCDGAHENSPPCEPCSCPMATRAPLPTASARGHTAHNPNTKTELPSPSPPHFPSSFASETPHLHMQLPSTC